MARILTPSLEVRADTVLIKERELPLAGEILVKPGDVVTPNQVIGRTFLPGAMMIERLPEKLGFSAIEVLAGLKVKEGQTVQRGDLLFEQRGLFGLFTTRYQAEHDGEIELITSSGHISIRQASRPVELRAFIHGVVQEIEAGRSASIVSRCTWIQGIFGVGGERSGTIKIIENSDLKQGDLADCQGKIIVFRGNPSGADLSSAMRSGAQGFICGSIDDLALKDFLGFELGVALTGDEPVTMSVIITEGFGKIPMSDAPWNLLLSLNGKEASINGTTQVRAGAQRPEVIIGISKDTQNSISKEEVTRSPATIEVGSQIRVIRFPYFGLKGEVLELPHELTKIATGAEVRVLVVKLETGETVTVPRANIEMIVS
jgi:hypothetical protein